MFSLYSNCVGIVGLIDKQVVISTQKAGSTTITKASTDYSYFNQDTFVRIIKRYLNKSGVNDFAYLFLRDPKRKLITGAVENVFAPYAREHLNYFNFDQDLVFSDSKQLLAFREFAFKNANSWFRFGIPEAHEHVVLSLGEFYFNSTANKEVYFQPHVMPFYTSMYKLLSYNDVKFKTCFLKEFEFKLNKNDLKQSRHTNAPFIDIMYQAFENVNNEFLKGIIFNEQQTVKDLQKFYLKPDAQLL